MYISVKLNTSRCKYITKMRERAGGVEGAGMRRKKNNYRERKKRKVKQFPFSPNEYMYFLQVLQVSAKAFKALRA